MRGRAVLLVAVGLVVGLVLGSAVTVIVALARGGSLLTVQRPAPADLAVPVSVPVTRQVLVESEVISGATSWADTVQVVASEGIVTQLPLEDGAEVVPGEVLLAVDDQPVVGLDMAFGLWRDLVRGDQGADVRELHGALSALGRFDGSIEDPVGDDTFRALGALDDRLENEPLRAASVVPVDPSGSRLEAVGVQVGAVLGEQVVGVRRHGDRIAVDDGGMAERYVEPGQQIELFDDQGTGVWSGTVAQVAVESSRSLVTVRGPQELPEQFAVASVVLAQSAGEVLTVPRVALIAQPDGSSTLAVVTGSGDQTRYGVETGMCTADLCEIRPLDESFPGEGSLVVVP